MSGGYVEKERNPGSPNRLWETLWKFTGSRSFVSVDQEDGQSLAPMKNRVRAHCRGNRLNSGPTATFHRFVVTKTLTAYTVMVQ
jgi:hypothetical protein